MDAHRRIVTKKKCNVTYLVKLIVRGLHCIEECRLEVWPLNLLCYIVAHSLYMFNEIASTLVFICLMDVNIVHALVDIVRRFQTHMYI